MGKIRFVRKVLLLITALACIGITLYNLSQIKINLSSKLYLVDEYVDTYYEELSSNVGLTTINGISNVYVNMANDGYTIYNSDVTQDYIDVSFVKDDEPSYRFYFTYPEGRITILCSEYENSYLGVSYITERK